MPELPEVETVRRGLQPALEGARLVRVQARRPDLRFPLPQGFVQRLTGARVELLERRAKYLLARLDRGDTLVMHLGMSGRFEIEGSDRSRPGVFRQEASTEDKHAHVVFDTDAGADGALGYFQHRFRVYGREGEPCLRPGCKGIVRRTVQAGRSTFYCPSCQR